MRLLTELNGGFHAKKYGKNIYKCPTWWLIPLSKRVLTPVINGTSRVNPFVTGVITHLLYKWDELQVVLIEPPKRSRFQGPLPLGSTWVMVFAHWHEFRYPMTHEEQVILELLSRWSYQILCKSSIFCSWHPKIGPTNPRACWNDARTPSRSCLRG